MKISKEIQWMLPFIHSVEAMIPKVKKLDSIKTIRTSILKRDRMYGELTMFTDNHFGLKIRVKYQYIEFNPLKVTIKKLSKVDILSTLAHELAHLYHDTHSPEHKILENQLNTVFMYKLKQQGYISEEKELS